MWFATDSGLNRYDGYEFAVYKEDPGDSTTLHFDDVSVIFEDSDGILWFGGGGGLDRFDRRTQTFTHVDTRGQVFSIYEDRAGTLWVGCWHGLYGYDRTTNEIIHSDQPHPGAALNWAARTESSVMAIHEDHSGNLWIGTVAGLYCLERLTGTFIPYRHDPNNSEILSSDSVSAILDDRQGDLWIGTAGGGLNRLAIGEAKGSDRAVGTFVHYRHDPDNSDRLSNDMVLSILEDSTGNLWVGTGNGFLEQFDPHTETFIHYRRLGANRLHAIAEDPAGNLWIGTNGEGLYRLGGDRLVLEHYIHYWQDPDHWWRNGSLSSHIVLSLDIDRAGELWAGTAYGGINIWGEVTESSTVARRWA